MSRENQFIAHRLGEERDHSLLDNNKWPEMSLTSFLKQNKWQYNIIEKQ